jgi:hypothetical protein
VSERTTKGHVEAAFRRVMKAIGGDFNEADPWTYSGPGPKWAPIPGRFALDQPHKNGPVSIVRCTPPYRDGEGCGESHITKRMKYAEFVDAARFMTEMLWSVQTEEEVSLSCPNCGVVGPVVLFTPAK